MAGLHHRGNVKWGKKRPKTGYFGEENWEDGGQPYKPIYVYNNNNNNNNKTSHFLK
jgi:hypothetical protein